MIDIIGDAVLLPFRSASIDAIICSALLEHVINPETIIQECLRCLKPDGAIYIEVPFLQPLHMIEAGDFRRYTKTGLELLLHDFTLIESGICIGPFSIVAWYLRKFLTIFIHSKYLINLIEFILGWLTFWIKYFDFFVAKAKNLDILNGGVYFLGQKKTYNK
jgi:ubiquinone/menaquinone biosynthesis C-methylase UbiE